MDPDSPMMQVNYWSLKLDALLKDQQPGMYTWNEAVSSCMYKIGYYVDLWKRS